jgi:hypothetical protein
VSLKGTIYELLAISNDVNAVRRGRVKQRIGRRIYGKGTGRIRGPPLPLATP